MNIKLLSSVAVLSLLTSVGFAQAQTGGGSRQDPSERSTSQMRTDQSDASRADQKNGAGSGKRADMKKDRAGDIEPHNGRANDSSRRAEEPNRSSRRAEEPDRANHRTDRADQDRDHDQTHRTERDRGGSSRRADQDRTDRDRTDGDRADVKVSIDPEKRSQISETIQKEHAENIRDVDFDVRVGGVVPARHRFNRLPADIATIVPQYRGYDYVVANGEIVIVEPSNHKIVYTMHEGRSASMDRRSTDCR